MYIGVAMLQGSLAWPPLRHIAPMWDMWLGAAGATPTRHPAAQYAGIPPSTLPPPSLHRPPPSPHRPPPAISPPLTKGPRVGERALCIAIRKPDRLRPLGCARSRGMKPHLHQGALFGKGTLDSLSITIAMCLGVLFTCLFPLRRAMAEFASSLWSPSTTSRPLSPYLFVRCPGAGQEECLHELGAGWISKRIRTGLHSHSSSTRPPLAWPVACRLVSGQAARVWPCLAVSDRVWPCLAVSGHVWPCLAMSGRV